MKATALRGRVYLEWRGNAQALTPIEATELANVLLSAATEAVAQDSELRDRFARMRRGEA